MTRLSRAAGLLAVLAVAAAAHADLTAGELLLLVNGNVPQSATLAAQYAKARGVPADRVLVLDTPAGEEITATEYDAKIAAPVRAYLQSPAGQGVRCLVTFFGLPLRVGGRPATAAEQAETAALRKISADLDRQSPAVASAMDQAAAAVGVAVPVDAVDSLSAAKAHIEAIESAMRTTLANTLDPARRQALTESVKAAQSVSVAAAVAANGGPPTPADPPAAQLQPLINRPRDAAARATVRRVIAGHVGAFALGEVVSEQLAWLNGDESDAAVDSELALVRLADFPRSRWQPNPLNWRAKPGPSPVLMVSRIDAPTPVLAARLIDASLATEAAGLAGKAVFDSRGLPAVTNGRPDGYGWFDQAIRDTATLVKIKTKMTVVTDDREALIPPRDVPGTALYCGWYSLRNYVPSCGFVRGAVAYHVASYELVSLHTVGEKGWVANLIKEGVAATLGPVSEPYLTAFPRPDELFPLLLTGRPTLAEAYWAACPMTSWKMALIGDPLYRPFAKNAPLAVADLPDGLRAWAEKTAGPAPGGR